MMAKIRTAALTKLCSWKKIGVVRGHLLFSRGPKSFKVFRKYNNLYDSVFCFQRRNIFSFQFKNPLSTKYKMISLTEYTPICFAEVSKVLCTQLLG